MADAGKRAIANPIDGEAGHGRSGRRLQLATMEPMVAVMILRIFDPPGWVSDQERLPGAPLPRGRSACPFPFCSMNSMRAASKGAFTCDAHRTVQPPSGRSEPDQRQVLDPRVRL